MCGAEEEISPHVSRECEALAKLRHTYIGSFSLDIEDVRSLNQGENCNFITGTGIPLVGHQFMGYKGPAKGPLYREKKGLEPINYSVLFNSNMSLIKAVPPLFSVKRYSFIFKSK